MRAAAFVFALLMLSAPALAEEDLRTPVADTELKKEVADTAPNTEQVDSATALQAVEVAQPHHEDVQIPGPPPPLSALAQDLLTNHPDLVQQLSQATR